MSEEKEEGEKEEEYTAQNMHNIVRLRLKWFGLPPDKEEKNLWGRAITILEIFVAVLIPVFMFAPAIAAVFGMPFLFGWSWVALFFVVMCVWVALVLRDGYYFTFSLMIVALVSLLSLFVVKCIIG